MPLEAPNLDDRTFEDLVREAQLRIPRYCREWTDFNSGDPGSALVDLFAWFTELMLYRINRVPERNYIKFLELMNLRPRPARPATAHVVLTPVTGGEGKPITVAIRSRFEVSGAPDTLFFETTEAIDLIPYPLDAIQVGEGSDYYDHSAQNERAAESFRPLGWTPQPANALYLGFRPGSEARPHFPEKLVLRFFAPPAAAAARPTARGDQQTRPVPTIVWEYRSSNDLARGADRDALERWRPLAILADETSALTREGSIVLRGPGVDIMATKVGLPTADDLPRYWIRGRLARGIPYPSDGVPEIAFVRSNVVAVENLATFRDEALGEADGFRRDFRLRHAPVEPKSLELIVEGVGDDEPWKRVDDFLGSEPDDKHFTLDASEGDVKFGTGARGMLPAPGGLVIARKYLAGGGAAGNVVAKAVSASPIGVSGLESVENPRPATGGADEESLEELKDRAPQALRGDGRAVTAEDYRRFAEAVPGVAKATVIEQRHPDYPGFDIPGTLTVIVVPDGTGSPVDDRAPRPPQELLDRVYAELARLRTVGSELFVTGPQYRRIGVGALIVPAHGVSDAEAREGVRKAIEDFLAPAPRLASKASTTAPQPKTAAPVHPRGWPFGEPFYPSQLYGVILGAVGADGRTRLVRNVTELKPTVDGDELPLGEAVRFDRPENADALPSCEAIVEIDRTDAEDLR